MNSSQTEVSAGYYTVGDPVVDEKAPPGPIEERWDTRKFEARLISPANRRELSVIIVGTGLAGASAAATLGEAGYRVASFCYQDSPRRAHSIAAQGGINAAKNYRNDSDSIYRLFYDTVKGGDFRSREANVTGSPRSAVRSSTNASPRACRSPASTAGCSPPARSAACRSRGPSTPAGRPASSCCSARTRRCNGRSRRALWTCTLVTRCST